ncbi:hypothetical protein RMSM_05117 [Rhodopirellula maiorica SM1]|uniref:Uncharacterized protein n=1 Tax=Rhodopirellula maiorica SM1 TaxID=1265738 RepID=M5RER1_9BACT|nr:hypothetical protein [Rhodopirellula maiorica]EMI17958.1 hypothetical protein RMSM_05117 [Rhodopirellula maiorica SM1]
MNIENRSDMQLAEKAARERWEMSDDQRNSVVSQLVAIIADPNAKNREKIAASRALAAFDRLNVDQQPKSRTNVNLNLALSEKKEDLRRRIERLTGSDDDQGA